MTVSVTKALNILVIISDYIEPISLRIISERTGYNKSTCVRLLDTLIENGFVIKKDYGKYCLGANAFYIARHSDYKKSLVEICKPFLSVLLKKYNETVQVSVIEDHKRYTICYLQGEVKIFGNDNREGTIMRNGIYNSSAGRVILSNYHKETLLHLVRHIGLPENWDEEDQALTLSELEQKLSVIKQNGYASVRTSSGNIGLAVPIYDEISCFAALGITFRENKYNEQEQANIIKELKSVSNSIRKKMPFHIW